MKLYVAMQSVIVRLLTALVLPCSHHTVKISVDQPSTRAYCYAELIISSTEVALTMGSSTPYVGLSSNERMARLSWHWWLVTLHDDLPARMPLTSCPSSY